MNKFNKEGGNPLPDTDKMFYFVGKHKGIKVYYCGWWNTYHEPLLAHHPSLGAKVMKRSNANRVKRRLRDPKIWGGDWSIELTDICSK